MTLSKTIYQLFSIGSTQEDRKLLKKVDWDVKYLLKQYFLEITTHMSVLKPCGTEIH